MKTGKKVNLIFSQCEKKAKELYDKNPNQIDYKELAIYNLTTINTITQCYKILKSLYQNIVYFKLYVHTLQVAKLKKDISKISKSIKDLQDNMNQRLKIINYYAEANKKHWMFYQSDKRRLNEIIEEANIIGIDTQELIQYADEGTAIEKVFELIEEGKSKLEALENEKNRVYQMLNNWLIARREVDKQIFLNNQLIQANQYEYDVRQFNKTIYEQALKIEQDKQQFWTILSELSFLEM